MISHVISVDSEQFSLIVQNMISSGGHCFKVEVAGESILSFSLYLYFLVQFFSAATPSFFIETINDYFFKMSKTAMNLC